MREHPYGVFIAGRACMQARAARAVNMFQESGMPEVSAAARVSIQLVLDAVQVKYP